MRRIFLEYLNPDHTVLSIAQHNSTPVLHAEKYYLALSNRNRGDKPPPLTAGLGPPVSQSPACCGEDGYQRCFGRPDMETLNLKNRGPL